VSLPPIVAISPGDGRNLEPWLIALGAAGLRALILREPGETEATLRAWAAVAAAAGIEVWVHDKHPAARALAAEASLGLHLPSGQDPREVDGPGPLGVSCHSEAEVDGALAAGADYVLLGPVWRPTSKPQDTRPAIGAARFLDLAAGRPVWALGGMTPQRWSVLRRGGATGAAVLGDLFGRHTPADAAARFAEFADA